MTHQIARSVGQAIEWAKDTGKLRGIGILPVYEGAQIVGVRKATFWEGLRVKFYDSEEKNQIAFACSKGLLALRATERNTNSAQYRLANSAVTERKDSLFEGKNLTALLSKGFLRGGEISSQIEEQPTKTSSKWVHTPIPKTSLRIAIAEKPSNLNHHSNWHVKTNLVNATGQFSYIPDIASQVPPEKFPPTYKQTVHHFDDFGKLTHTTQTKYLLQARTADDVRNSVARYVEEDSEDSANPKARTFCLKEMVTSPTNLMHEDSAGNLTLWQLKKHPTKNVACWYTARYDANGSALPALKHTENGFVTQSTKGHDWVRCANPFAVDKPPIKFAQNVRFNEQATCHIIDDNADTANFPIEAGDDEHLVVHEDVDFQTPALPYRKQYQERLEALLEKSHEVRAKTIEELVDTDFLPLRSQLTRKLANLNLIINELIQVDANRKKMREVYKSNQNHPALLASKETLTLRPSAFIEGLMRELQLDIDPVYQVDHSDAESIKAFYAREFSLANAARNLETERKRIAQIQITGNANTAALEWGALSCKVGAINSGEVGLTPFNNLLKIPDAFNYRYRLFCLDKAIDAVYTDATDKSRAIDEQEIARIDELVGTLGIYSHTNIEADKETLEKERVAIIATVESHIANLELGHRKLWALHEVTRKALDQGPDFLRANANTSFANYAKVDDLLTNIEGDIAYFNHALERLKGSFLRDEQIETGAPGAATTATIRARADSTHSNGSLNESALIGMVLNTNYNRAFNYGREDSGQNSPVIQAQRTYEEVFSPGASPLPATAPLAGSAQDRQAREQALLIQVQNDGPQLQKFLAKEREALGLGAAPINIDTRPRARSPLPIPAEQPDSQEEWVDVGSEASSQAGDSLSDEGDYNILRATSPVLPQPGYGTLNLAQIEPVDNDPFRPVNTKSIFEDDFYSEVRRFTPVPLDHDARTLSGEKLNPPSRPSSQKGASPIAPIEDQYARLNHNNSI